MRSTVFFSDMTCASCFTLASAFCLRRLELRGLLLEQRLDAGDASLRLGFALGELLGGLRVVKAVRVRLLRASLLFDFDCRCWFREDDGGVFEREETVRRRDARGRGSRSATRRGGEGVASRAGAIPETTTARDAGWVVSAQPRDLSVLAGPRGGRAERRSKRRADVARARARGDAPTMEPTAPAAAPMTNTCAISTSTRRHLHLHTPGAAVRMSSLRRCFWGTQRLLQLGSRDAEFARSCVFVFAKIASITCV